MAADGKQLKECYECGYQTHQEKCPRCDSELTGDKVMDSAINRLESGEDVDLDELLKGDQWEQVNPGSE